MTHVLSLDFGTGGVRAGVFDLDAGRLVAAGEAPYARGICRPTARNRTPRSGGPRCGA